MSTIVKALEFKVNGGFKVVNRELTNLHEGVYRSEFKTEDGRSTKYCNIYLKVGDLYVFSSEFVSESNLEDEFYIERMVSVGKDVFAYIESLYRPLGIYIESYRLQGMDYKTLESKVELAKENYKLAKEKREKDKANEALRKIEVRNEELILAENEFREGEMIAVEDFIDLCKKHEVSLHIRTIGTLTKRVIEINNECSYRYYGKPYNSTVLGGVVENLRTKVN